MKPILALTDFSDRGDRAVFRAADIARQKGAKLIIFHAIDADLPDRIIDNLLNLYADRLGELEEEVRKEFGISVDVRVSGGVPWQEILKEAKKRDVQLLVLGPHHYTGMLEFFKGTTLERIARRANVPILVAYSSPRQPWKKVVACTDFSTSSLLAVEEAVDLCPDTKVQVLHVNETTRHGPFHFTGNGNHERETVAEVGFDSLRENLGSKVDQVMTWYEKTESDEGLYKTVRKTVPDLIALGIHGRSLFYEAVMGSHTEEFLADPFSDILVVPPPKRPPLRERSSVL